MRALRTDRRPGMTLIELLVVISLIIVLVGLGLLISPRLAEDQRSTRTTDLISGWLLMCKNRAYRDQQNRGVRLIVGADGHCHELVLIERPEDYRGGILQVPSPFAGGGELPEATAFVHGKDLTKTTNPGGEAIVEAYAQDGRGDFLVFDTMEPIPYNSHFIYSMQYYPPNAQAPQGGTHIFCATFDKLRPSIINGGAPIPPGSGYSKSDQFRFVRQPRPLVGEPTLQLPRDMAIDLQLTWAQGGTRLPGLGTQDQFDIVFSPRGQIHGSNSNEGKVILRVRNVTRAPDDGDQLVVVIYTRSGIIATHPVDLTPNGSGGLLSPYSFARDGDASGF